MWTEYINGDARVPHLTVYDIPDLSTTCYTTEIEKDMAQPGNTHNSSQAHANTGSFLQHTSDNVSDIYKVQSAKYFIKETILIYKQHKK